MIVNDDKTINLYGHKFLILQTEFVLDNTGLPLFRRSADFTLISEDQNLTFSFSEDKNFPHLIKFSGFCHCLLAALLKMPVNCAIMSHLSYKAVNKIKK